MGKQVHKGERKPPKGVKAPVRGPKWQHGSKDFWPRGKVSRGFWKSPETLSVLTQVNEGTLDPVGAAKQIGVNAADIKWYAKRLLKRRRRVPAWDDATTPVERVVIGEGGRLVIPAPYRQALGVREGDKVILQLEEAGLRILTPDQALRRAQMLVRRYVPAGRSLADELIAERRQEARRD